MSSPSGADQDRDQELSQDLIFDLLSSPRRRIGLYYLRKRGGSSTITELAEDIASLEYDIPVEELSRQQRKRVYVSLYQTHIPKMADAGIIDYDDESSVVTLTDRADRIDAYLTADDGDSYPWPYHYLALSVLSAGLFSWTVLSDGAVGELTVGLIVTVAFALSGIAQLAHWRYRRRDPPMELSEESFP